LEKWFRCVNGLTPTLRRCGHLSQQESLLHAEESARPLASQRLLFTSAAARLPLDRFLGCAGRFAGDRATLEPRNHGVVNSTHGVYGQAYA